mgnify:CR=1 FL=1
MTNTQNFEGVGGSYVIDAQGNRQQVEATLDKLAAPAFEEPAPEPAPVAVSAKDSAKASASTAQET